MSSALTLKCVKTQRVNDRDECKNTFISVDSVTIVMLSLAFYPYSQSSSSSPFSSSSSPLHWAEWVPECLQPAIAIASEMTYHQQSHHHEEEEEGEDGEEEDEDQETSASSGEGEGEEEELGANQEEDMDLLSDHYEFSHMDRHRLILHQDQHHRHHHHHHQQQDQQHQNQQNRSMACLSCKEIYTARTAGTCRECYDEASETEEALKKEIEELHARIAFLKAWAPEAMDEDCADIVLECSDGSKIRAHRAVLMSRSSVFKAMLESKMEETRTNTIKITDFAYEVLKLFIHYLYTAEIYPESLDECAFDLLALAEKYNVNQLKSVCERYMISKVNSGNALSNFEYASLHGAKTLKEAALSNIMENIHELPAKNEYQDLVNRDAKLVVEIFEAYLAKQRAKSLVQ